MFWRWAGHKLITSTNESLQGELTVGKIEGNPFSGYVFKDINVTMPEGEILHAKALMLRLSLWSVIRLKPVIDKIALYTPVLSLARDTDGQWNINRLYRPQEGSSSSIFEYFKYLTFSQIVIDHGQVEVQQPGGSWRF